MASTEIVDIVNKENNVVGMTDVDTAHNEKLMHRVAGVFVFSPDGDLYLQTGNKYEKLDLSVGGHVQKGESYEQAAQREMHEEIGLNVALTHVSTFLPKEARLNHFWAIFTANGRYPKNGTPFLKSSNNTSRLVFVQTALVMCQVRNVFFSGYNN